MDGRPIDIASAMGTRKAILNYLKGELSLDTVLGAIDDPATREAAEHFLRDLDGYGDAHRRESLQRVLRDAA
jgi:hypothetical protein